MTEPEEKSNREISTTRVIRLATEAEGFLEFDLPELALQRAEILLASKAGRLAGLTIKSECLRHQEKYSHALPLLEEAVELAPENEALWINLGWCRKRTNRLDLALAAMEGLLQHNPGSAIGHFNLACYLALANQRKQCLGELGLAFRLDDSFRALVAGESDFDGMRDDPEFQELVRG